MRHKLPLAAAILCSALIGACGDSAQMLSSRNGVIGIDSADWANSPYSCTDHALTWNDVNDWYYQLQFMDYFELSQTKFDLIVMDSEPREPLNRNVLDRIRCAGDGQKLVLAYIPIGKAEFFRNYWQNEWSIGNPSWIVGPNADWVGEYVVQYSDPGWKSIIMGSPSSRVDVAIAAGFDGVVLDGVDLYQYFLPDNPNAIIEMDQFVGEIRDYAITASGNPDFGIFVQNTEELINEPSIDWASKVTGLIKLSHFFAPVDQQVDVSLTESYTEHLSYWTAAGKLVLSIDYATDAANISNAHRRATELGYVPLTVNALGLDNLTIPAGYEPD